MTSTLRLKKNEQKALRTSDIVKMSGIIVFNPDRAGMKKTHRVVDTNVIVKISNETELYYQWFLRKKFGDAYVVNLGRSTWGAHITVVRDKDHCKLDDNFMKMKERFDGKRISFEINVSTLRRLKYNEYWIIDVCNSPDINEIRSGLKLRDDYNVHITVARRM